MLRPHLLALIGGVLVARRATANMGEACMEDILAELPHLANTDVAFDIDDNAEFTLLAPSQDASVDLTELLLTEGCEMLPMDAFEKIVASWVITGTQVAPSDLSTAPLTFAPPATQPGLSLALFTDDSGAAFAEIFNAAGDSNNVVGLVPGSASVCGGRGTLYVTDELILYPALLTRVRAMEDTPHSPCDEMAAAEDDAVPVNEAFLSNLEFELAGNKTTATIPISALVNSTAFDEGGNEVPVTTEVSLALMNDLDAALNEAGTEFNVQVPVNVSLSVVTTGCDDVVAITTPVDISIGVQIVINGNEIGSGNAMMAPRCEETGVALFERCGGMADGRSFVSACASSTALCLSKNAFFAMCIPPQQLQRFVDRGWEAMQLQCRP